MQLINKLGMSDTKECCEEALMPPLVRAGWWAVVRMTCVGRGCLAPGLTEEKAAACGEREEQGGQPRGGRRWLREGRHGRSGAREGSVADRGPDEQGFEAKEG